VAVLIEQALIFALGFLLCALLSLLILPAFWRRALRLSMRRLEMLTPLSMAEVMAQRDQLRAQAAVEQRRIEQRLEAMTRDRARHMSEIGRNAAVIARLEAEIKSLTAAMGEREAELRAAWTELGGLHIAFHDLASRLREAKDARAQAESLRQSFDVLRAEKAALELQVSALKAQERRGHELAPAAIIAANEAGRPKRDLHAALDATLDATLDAPLDAPLDVPLAARRAQPDHPPIVN